MPSNAEHDQAKRAAIRSLQAAERMAQRRTVQALAAVVARCPARPGCDGDQCDRILTASNTAYLKTDCGILGPKAYAICVSCLDRFLREWRDDGAEGSGVEIVDRIDPRMIDGRP